MEAEACPYYYLRELNPEEAESRGIKFVRRNGKEIYMLPTNKENVWCCVGFWPNDSSALDVCDIETRIVEETYSKFSELVANCPLHSFNGNFCKQKFWCDMPFQTEWRDRGKLHRLDGPAVVGDWKYEWFLRDKKTDEETVKEARAKAIGEDEIKLV
jgi:hypothetical protein